MYEKKATFSAGFSASTADGILSDVSDVLTTGVSPSSTAVSMFIN